MLESCGQVNGLNIVYVPSDFILIFIFYCRHMNAHSQSDSGVAPHWHGQRMWVSINQSHYPEGIC